MADIFFNFPTTCIDVVECFEEILKICDVKRKRHGNSSVRVLPFNGYTKCLKYIREHHLTCKADEKRFITHYKKVLSQELAQRQHQYDKHYHKVESEVKSLMSSDQWEVVKFEHIDALVDYDEVKEKVDKICSNTFFGDFVINEPKIILNSSENSFTEVYALKIPVDMKLKLKDYYMACAGWCGYIY